MQKRDNHKQKPLESWVLNRFGGTDAKQSLSEHAEKLVLSTGINLPPVSMVKLARVIGVDPWPIYEPGTEGAIKVINGRMRIVLRKSNQNRHAPSAMVGRTRFTYAHELGHALFYDLASNPPVRLAPTGFHRVEEQLCNKAASHFLVPGFLLKSELAGTNVLSPELLRELARKFQTSIQAIAYRVGEVFGDRMGPNQFYMLSANVSGIRGSGLVKPRCLICIVGRDLLEKKISFLQSYQGIDHIKRMVAGQKYAWSLEEYFHKLSDKQINTAAESEEEVECPQGLVLGLKVRHTSAGSLVWSEGSLKVIS